MDRHGLRMDIDGHEKGLWASTDGLYHLSMGYSGHPAGSFGFQRIPFLMGSLEPDVRIIILRFVPKMLQATSGPLTLGDPTSLAMSSDAVCRALSAQAAPLGGKELSIWPPNRRATEVQA